jgi:hypothetical protein
LNAKYQVIKNYKKIFRNPFLYRKSEKPVKEFAVDLRKGRGCGSVSKILKKKVEPPMYIIIFPYFYNQDEALTLHLALLIHCPTIRTANNYLSNDL